MVPTNISSRIYHGHAAPPDSRNYQLLLMVDILQAPDYEAGGAVLIKENWALTSAHMVTKRKPHDHNLRPHTDYNWILRKEIAIRGGSGDAQSAHWQTRTFLAKHNVFPHPLWAFQRWNGYGRFFQFCYNYI